MLHRGSEAVKKPDKQEILSAMLTFEKEELRGTGWSDKLFNQVWGYQVQSRTHELSHALRVLKDLGYTIIKETKP